ncbi:transcription termination/antitermination protein NusG [Martelella soudanensis]|uniref:transcription termination/antitermination protein NusG n=1 Tax=unclassified Martelella TaxID=2629616 RepID=UPI0015DE7CF9|nr:MULTISPECIES: transcription termination/antitermination NusG family protein [unclassified Martelella]
MTEYRKIGASVDLAYGLKFEDRLRLIRLSGRSALAEKAAEDAPWYVLQVMTGREQVVCEALTECGAEALSPTRKGPKRRRRHKVLPPQDIPLMAGYVLVRFAWSETAVSALLGFEHVRGVLGGWLSPFALENERVVRIMQKSGDGRFDWERVSKITVVAGERVRIGEGMFAGLEADVVTPNSKGKGDVVVEVDMFGQKTPVNFPLAILEKL